MCVVGKRIDESINGEGAIFSCDKNLSYSKHLHKFMVGNNYFLEKTKAQIIKEKD